VPSPKRRQRNASKGGRDRFTSLERGGTGAGTPNSSFEDEDHLYEKTSWSTVASSAVRSTASLALTRNGILTRRKPRGRRKGKRRSAEEEEDESEGSAVVR
jgi:hypothetical protein